MLVSKIVHRFTSGLLAVVLCVMCVLGGAGHASATPQQSTTFSLSTPQMSYNADEEMTLVVGLTNMDALDPLGFSQLMFQLKFDSSVFSYSDYTYPDPAQTMKYSHADYTVTGFLDHPNYRVTTPVISDNGNGEFSLDTSIEALDHTLIYNGSYDDLFTFKFKVKEDVQVSSSTISFANINIADSHKVSNDFNPSMSSIVGVPVQVNINYIPDFPNPDLPPDFPTDPPIPVLSSEKNLLTAQFDHFRGMVDHASDVVFFLMPHGQSPSDSGTLTFSHTGQSLRMTQSPLTSPYVVSLDDLKSEGLTVTAEDGTTRSYAVQFIPAPVTSVKPHYSDLVLHVGNHLQNGLELSFTDLPSINALHTDIIWASSHPNVASVNPAGMIEAHAAGTATITGTYRELDYETSITVVDPKPVVTGLTVTPVTASVYVGDTVQIDSHVDYSTPQIFMMTRFSTLDVDAQDSNVSTTASDELTYSSSDTSIATVSDTGEVYGVAAGTADIRVKIAGFSETVTVHVMARPVVVPDPGTPSNEVTVPPVTPSPVVTVPTTPPVVEAKPAKPVVDIFLSEIVKADSNVVSVIQKKLENVGIASQTFTTPVLKPSDTKGHWAEKTVELFVKLDVIKGYKDGTAQPDKNISRAEFISILSRLFPVQGNKQAAFNDIQNHWANASIAQFASAGIISGYGDGTFKPNGTITREEMIVILSRIINFQNVQKDVNKVVTDPVSAWAKEYVDMAVQAGIINGKGNGQFDGRSSSTRAEALQVILNTLNLNAEIKTLLDSLE
ncbi:autotransporter adhesin [Paenibacillus algicola]|uniref:Autotransporter adhesin n=1 Tax=Paenibacillus algicola TaxID=2565926 RepID=A0A4P8XNP4_9BACL|nr:S-layer homology domain-containing protein [Paenibacillus algicola]QCT04506.1 autotransporter adhesin [Paenibacillus algicola]